MSIALILAAAGSGERFGSQVPKQFHEFEGKPIYLHSLEAFAGLVDHVALAVAPEFVEDVQRRIEGHGDPLPTCCIIPGGSDRQESVYAALRATPDQHEVILVHDAARPLITARDIRTVIDALDANDAAILGYPCTDTVKRSDVDGRVIETIPREALWLAQTPQGFRRSIGMAAYQAAFDAGLQATDDAQILEAHGVTVQVVEAHDSNLKITDADDLAVAQALWRARLKD